MGPRWTFDTVWYDRTESAYQATALAYVPATGLRKLPPSSNYTWLRQRCAPGCNSTRKGAGTYVSGVFCEDVRLVSSAAVLANVSVQCSVVGGVRVQVSTPAGRSKVVPPPQPSHRSDPTGSELVALGLLAPLLLLGTWLYERYGRKRRRRAGNGATLVSNAAYAYADLDHDFAVQVDEIAGVLGMPPSLRRQAQKIDAAKLTLLDAIGCGSTGIVHKAMYDDGITVSYLVAAKAVRPDEASATTRRSLLTEAALMAQFEHPNVIRLLGMCTAMAQPMIVIEYAERGSLKAQLDTQRWFAFWPCPEAFHHAVESQVLAGCAYLASCNYVHCDIAARNVLVRSDWRLLLSDYGLSRPMRAGSDYYRILSGKAMPIRWTAPEVMQHHKVSTASDVWSFGVFMFEVLTGGKLPCVPSRPPASGRRF